MIVAINILIAVGSPTSSPPSRVPCPWHGWWLSTRRRDRCTAAGGTGFNGVAGLLNIFCMTGWWGIYSSKKKDDMLWPDMIWLYILAYDVWNFQYTYLNLPTHTWYCGLALLLAPTVADFPVEQGRLDSEPRQHAGHLVHVGPGVPSVPGPQRCSPPSPCCTPTASWTPLFVPPLRTPPPRA